MSDQVVPARSHGGCTEPQDAQPVDDSEQPGARKRRGSGPRSRPSREIDARACDRAGHGTSRDLRRDDRAGRERFRFDTPEPDLRGGGRHEHQRRSERGGEGWQSPRRHNAFYTAGSAAVPTPSMRLQRSPGLMSRKRLKANAVLSRCLRRRPRPVLVDKSLALLRAELRDLLLRLPELLRHDTKHVSPVPWRTRRLDRRRSLHRLTSSEGLPERFPRHPELGTQHRVEPALTHRPAAVEGRMGLEHLAAGKHFSEEAVVGFPDGLPAVDPAELLDLRPGWRSRRDGHTAAVAAPGDAGSASRRESSNRSSSCRSDGVSAKRSSQGPCPARSVAR